MSEPEHATAWIVCMESAAGFEKVLYDTGGFLKPTLHKTKEKAAEEAREALHQRYRMDDTYYLCEVIIRQVMFVETALVVETHNVD